MDLHYTKEEVVKNDFLFVSYKHEDKDIFNEVVDYLVEQGVRLWYDVDLIIGESWLKTVEGLINHENCKGVIFFNSVNSFKSDPVYNERVLTLEKLEDCKKKSKRFFVFPINIGKPSTMLLLRDVFASLPDDDKEIDKIFPLKYLQGISSLFGSDIIYCYADPSGNGEYKEKLVNNIKKALPSVIDKKALSERELVNSLGTGQASISLGICKNGLSDKLPDYFLLKNQRVEYQGTTYIVDQGSAYATQKISWRPVYCDKDVFVLLSNTVVDTKNGGDALNAWLENEFSKIAFTESELKEIKQIRLLSEDDISKAQMENLLIFDDASSHWWIESRSGGALQKVIKKDGTIYNSGYNFRTKKSGVRPIIHVTKDYIESIK